MTYKNAGKPTFLFCIYRCIVTLPFGGEHYMNNNLKGELAVMDSLGIKKDSKEQEKSKNTHREM